MPINIAVAETLRELRQKKGVSQEKLAEAIDSHQVYISEIENGKKIQRMSRQDYCKLDRQHQLWAWPVLSLSLSDFAAMIEEKL